MYSTDAQYFSIFVANRTHFKVSKSFLFSPKDALYICLGIH